MKTITTYILTAIFTISGLISFALTPRDSHRKSEIKKELASFAFVSAVPSEAEFDEMITLYVETELAEITAFIAPVEADFEEAESTLDLTVLAPATPDEAEFEETESTTLDFTKLAPTAPAVADFEETESTLDLTKLAPTTPSEADFDETETTIDLTTLAPTTPAEADFED